MFTVTSARNRHVLPIIVYGESNDFFLYLLCRKPRTSSSLCCTVVHAYTLSTKISTFHLSFNQLHHSTAVEISQLCDVIDSLKDWQKVEIFVVRSHACMTVQQREIRFLVFSEICHYLGLIVIMTVVRPIVIYHVIFIL